jgi:hypothetical protein
MNSLFLLEAKVTIRVRGIGGDFIPTVAWLVNAPDINSAKQKFVNHVKQDYAHMQFESIQFEWVKQVGEIK